MPKPSIKPRLSIRSGIQFARVLELGEDAVLDSIKNIEKDPAFHDLLNSGAVTTNPISKDGKLNRFAKRFFQKSIETNPNLIFAYLNLALIFGREGEIPKAIELVETALRIQPNSKEALHLQKSLNNG